MIGTIHIHELTIQCVVGVYPAERHTPQSLVVDIDLDLDLAPVTASGAIADTVDYDEVCRVLTAFAQRRRFHIVEIFAEQAAALLLARWASVQRVAIRAVKPDAVAAARGVGVSVERVRDDRASGSTPALDPGRDPARGEELRGRVALVTGSGRRIGAAIARDLSAAGATVVIHANRSRDAATALADELGGIAVFADLSDEAERERLIAEVARRAGGLDALVNNASVFERRPLEEIGPEDLRRMLMVNTEAPLMLIRAALPHLRARGGCVVNMVDNASGDRPWRNHSHYCASKAALLAITRSLAVELAPEVRVNAVGPGAILFQDWESPERRARVLERIPQGRMGAAAEVAEAVRFLVAGPAHVTGQVICVDGGWSVS